MTDDIFVIPDSLAAALKNGRVIPFIGSGISRAVERKADNRGERSFSPLFPSWKEYVDILAEELEERGKIEEAAFVRSRLDAVPPKYLEAMQTAFDELGETNWDESLDKNFDIEKKEADERSLAIPRLIWQLGSHLIITTNIDRVLQWSCPNPAEFRLLDVQKKEFGKIHKEAIAKYPTVIYLHGHIDNKANIIFTKEQYKSFYNHKLNEAKLETLKTLLTRRTFLFLGFSLDDPYFLLQLEYFHTLYDGGADSLFVALHKSEKDNPNIPDYVRKIVYENYGESLEGLLSHMADISQKNAAANVTGGENAIPASSEIITAGQPAGTAGQERRKEDVKKSEIKKRPVVPGKLSEVSASGKKPGVFGLKWQTFARVAGAIVLLAFAGAAFWLLASSLMPDNAPIDSVAVLPFQNDSTEPDTEYLSDLSKTLIFRLSKLPELKVSPTSSVARYKGQEIDPIKTGNELEVKAVMTGRIAQRGDNLTIYVELFDVRKKKVIWREQYDRKVTDLLATQREIAVEIAQNLKLKLSDQEKGLTKHYTESNEAYLRYLKGRSLYEKRTKDDIERGINVFQEAIVLDPNFALAYVGIADSYNSMPSYPFLSPKNSIPKAKAAAQKALELDPDLAEAYTALATSMAVYDWNWAGSKQKFKQALLIDQKLSGTHYRYGLSYLTPTDNTSEGIVELKKAVELEPESLIMGANLAAVYLYGRQNEMARDQALEIYKKEPGFAPSRFWLGHAYNANGMYAETITLCEEALQADPDNQLFLWVKGYAYARAGRRKEAENVIQKFRELAKKQQYVISYCVAQIYAGLGEKDKALDELDKAYSERDWYLSRLNVDPFMDPLRDEPRFQKLVKNLNFP